MMENLGKDRPTSSGGSSSKSDNSDSLKKWLKDEARFVIYPTPPGEWGGLTEDVTMMKISISFIKTKY